ncbi:hypothetical protein [Winogradskyella endarachnes]|uniref:Uncharacterized protein n=1 Tax=Winogradskyella endarachnes TaxID=2681965 RepID=A0A6L6U898_9FLAO|nr:hypothetical protein [Winogradskyella endarachnes]MUU78525.1 hypothetical protein [Winogradskyella endarachnes]
MVNSAGTSIKENAALNKNFYDRWHLNIGFSRLEFNTKDKFSVKYKLMPVAFVYNVYALFRYKFELKHSLRVGEFVYSINRRLENSNYDEIVASSTAGYMIFLFLTLTLISH